MRRVTFLFFSIGTLLGCGSSSSSDATGPASQSTVDDACATECAARKKCSSTIDETNCINTCKNQAAPYVGKVRSDYVGYIADCDRTASCDKLNDCDDQAKASIAPSSYAQTFCDDYVKKATDCKIATDKSKCLESFKMFTDETLSSAAACNAKACLDFVGCVLSTVGVK